MNQTYKKAWVYRITIEDGKVAELLREEEGGFGRELYKRNPKGMEERLTPEVFGEFAEWMFSKNSLESAVNIYESIYEDSEYAAITVKAYLNFRKRITGSRIERDALHMLICERYAHI